MNDTTVDLNLDIFEVAKSQKHILLLILISLGFIIVVPTLAILAAFLPGFVVISKVLIWILYIAYYVAFFYKIYKLAVAMNVKYPVLCVIAMIVPIVNLVMLVSLNIRATKAIRKAGYKVGLLGASLKKIKEGGTQAQAPAIPTVTEVPSQA